MMLKNPFHREIKALLPGYLNKTLSAAEKRAVDKQLRDNSAAQAELLAWQKIRSAVIAQPQATPSAVVRQRLLAQTRTTRQLHIVPRWLPWAGGLVLAATLLIALWLIVQPGISLQWSAGGPVTSFRVYRAPVGSDHFELVYAAPAQPNAQEYTYVDTLIWPSQTYEYRVDGISQDQPAVSRAITASGQGALPGQMMILVTSLIGGCCTFIMMRSYLDSRQLSGSLRI